MRYYTTEALGPSRSLTPEGFLVCHDVPIARTGEMVYAPGEVPVEPGADGVIYVTRDASEVFRDETIASFLGKPVTADHPPETVTVRNWRVYACGSVQNVRRDGDLLVADLLITDPAMIAEIEAGKREVSCGYSADYEEISPGRGRQFNIIGNHVALVAHGRCGSRCAIGDSEMVKRTWRDRIRTAFKAQDEAALEEALEQGEAPAASSGVNVHVHYPEAEKAETEPEKDEEAAADPVEERFAKIEAALAGLAEAVNKIMSAEKAEAETMADADPDPDAKEDEKEDESTKDAAPLHAEFQAAVSLAEILSPGIALPTFDRAASAKSTADSICLLRRRALAAAYKAGTHRDAITAALAGRDADFARMSCDALFGVFTAAGNAVRARANRVMPNRAIGDGRAPGNTVQGINERNRAFWRR